MLGRRSHSRICLCEASQGTLRILRHVEVERQADGEFVAISETPMRWGARMALDLVDREPPVRVNVRVVDSRPVIEEGTVRHRVRLVIEGLTRRRRTRRRT